MDNFHITSMDIYSLLMAMLMVYLRYPRNMTNFSKKMLSTAKKKQVFSLASIQQKFWYVVSIWLFELKLLGIKNYSIQGPMYKIWWISSIWQKTYKVINRTLFLCSGHDPGYHKEIYPYSSIKVDELWRLDVTTGIHLMCHSDGTFYPCLNTLNII